eukprot:4857744-Pleurochrysis_carterae.AAC.1
MSQIRGPRGASAARAPRGAGDTTARAALGQRGLGRRRRTRRCGPRGCGAAAGGFGQGERGRAGGRTRPTPLPPRAEWWATLPGSLAAGARSGGPKRATA